MYLILFIKNQTDLFIRRVTMKITGQLQAKKAWMTPKLTNHGTVELITQTSGVKKKDFGFADDFNTIPTLTTVP
jgi:hypothetical protein